ncbi:WbqC family protein [Sphaerisporangium perillae]|uniref:WbqC family protein n=1 Tax=Sphaerisporangium perillae TaxID=2935860 RepID=UPI003558E5EC
MRDPPANLFPRLTTLAKVFAADCWIVLDDVQFTRRDYRHRARLAPLNDPQRRQGLTVPGSCAPSGAPSSSAVSRPCLPGPWPPRSRATSRAPRSAASTGRPSAPGGPRPG